MFKRKPSETLLKRCLNINYEELNRLKDDASSFVMLVKHVHHLSLHPYHLANVKKSIDEKLSEEFCSYNRKLGGIILGFQNVRVLDNVAPINADMCFVHMDVEVEFFVFTPAVDQVHKGVVNKQSKEQLSCLVHGVFNVFLPRPSDGDDEWLGSNAHAGQEIKFQITYIDLEGRLPYIRAELLSIISDDSGVSTGEEQSETPKRLKKNKTPENTARMKKRKLSESLDENLEKTPARKKRKTDMDELIRVKKSIKKEESDDAEMGEKSEAEESTISEEYSKEESDAEERCNKKIKGGAESEVSYEELPVRKSSKKNKGTSQSEVSKDEESVARKSNKKRIQVSEELTVRKLSENKELCIKEEEESEDNPEENVKKSVKNEVCIKEEEESEVSSAEKLKKKKSKKKKTKDEIIELLKKDYMEDVERLFGDKRTKKRKNKDKCDKSDVSCDLNLTSLFDELKDLNMANSVIGGDSTPSGDAEWSSRVIKLPPDSDLDEVLKDVKSTSKKKGVKRRASVYTDNPDSDNDFVKPVKKIKRISN